MWGKTLRGCVAVLAGAVFINACSNDSRNSTEPAAPAASGATTFPMEDSQPGAEPPK